MRAGIIGAGLSGLVTAKTLLEEGFGVTVFEKDDEVGGVWARSRRYPGLHTQNPRDTYAFSDFPMPRTYPEFPSGEQAQAYLAAYADQFGVTEHVRFRTTVQHAAPDRRRVDGALASGRGRRRRSAHGAVRLPGHLQRHLLRAARSRLSRAGRVPRRGRHGAAQHAAQRRGSRCAASAWSSSAARKSACDAAMAALPAAARTTLVFRHATWKMPKKFFGVVPLRYVLTTRFSETLFRGRELRGVEKVLHTAGAPGVWLFWRGVEALLRATYRLGAAGMVPETRIEDVVSCALSLATDGLYEAVRDGRLHARQAGVRALHPGRGGAGYGRIGRGGRGVFGTGFRQEVPFLEECGAAYGAGRGGRLSPLPQPGAPGRAAAGVRGIQQQPVQPAYVGDRRAVGGAAVDGRAAAPRARADAGGGAGAVGVAARHTGRWRRPAARAWSPSTSTTSTTCCATWAPAPPAAR